MYNRRINWVVDLEPLKQSACHDIKDGRDRPDSKVGALRVVIAPGCRRDKATENGVHDFARVYHDGVLQLVLLGVQSDADVAETGSGSRNYGV